MRYKDDDDEYHVGRRYSQQEQVGQTIKPRSKLALRHCGSYQVPRLIFQVFILWYLKEQLKLRASDACKTLIMD